MRPYFLKSSATWLNGTLMDAIARKWPTLHEKKPHATPIRAGRAQRPTLPRNGAKIAKMIRPHLHGAPRVSLLARVLPMVVPLASLGAAAAACSSSPGGAVSVDDAGSTADADAGSDAPSCSTTPCPASKIQHVVVIVQENHTFDNHFGLYCTAPTGSSPTCTDGPACCEAAPAKEPSGATPFVLDDAENGDNSPVHKKGCELDEINGGKMDQFVTSTLCGNPHNFAYTPKSVAQPLWDLAARGAIADHFFQPVAGESSANDMYLARAQWVFDDNVYPTDAVGIHCAALAQRKATYTETNLGDLMNAKGVGWSWYGEGYDRMVAAGADCPDPPPDCIAQVKTYPCDYDPGDVPFAYYASTRDNPLTMKDYAKLGADLAAGQLPAVSFVKAIGYRSEHPSNGMKISDGLKFVTDTIAAIEGSAYAKDTLILVVYDEGGGYFDHVAPPQTSADNQPYGTRVPFVAVGPFAKKNFVSHALMDHASIVKFIEWNWLGATGQLGGRDVSIANLGSLLDEATTGTKVPED
jgi:phospholipase C